MILKNLCIDIHKEFQRLKKGVTHRQTAKPYGLIRNNKLGYKTTTKVVSNGLDRW